MSVTIYHNPDCSTSRKVLAWLRDHGHSPVVIEYLKTPPDAAALGKILKMMGVGAHAILRRKGDAYEALGDAGKIGEQELVARMVAEPVLIERPIVVRGRSALLCRPAERVAELFP